MIAASAKGVQTPEPGKHFFTAHCMDEIRKHLDTGGHLFVTSIVIS